MFREIKAASRKLEQIYLEKEREIIKQFSESTFRNMTNVNYGGRLDDTVSISPEDQNKIKKFEKMIFESTMLPPFIQLLKKIRLNEDATANICIEVFEGLAKIDKPTQERYLD